MDIILLSAAFISGFIALKCQLPPLVGFLVAGFALNFLGFESNSTIELLADLGVTLLLFTIGLKLDIKTLLSKEIWAGASIHNLLSTLLFTACLMALKVVGVSSFAALAFDQLLLLAFALSFSSTVFAIKTIQEKGEMNAIYGNIAIGFLVMQDIFAVVFLTISTGKMPEWYAIFLFLLPLLRPLFYRFLTWVGHGEMLVIFGIFFALVMGAGLFELVGIKADLGALILGMILAGHKKSSELSKALFNLKELFLVCFFLNIGLSEHPTLSGFITALLFLLLLPIKGALYYLVFNGFKFRVRTSFLASLSLFNYSEFGLIVGGLAFKMGWLPGDLLVSIAIAVSLSFILAAPLNRFGHGLYQRSSNWLKEQSAEKLNALDKRINPGQAQVLILGMGRIGSGAYDELTHRHGPINLGIEVRQDAVQRHIQNGRSVIQGDATDPDFWERILDTGKVELILLAMPHHLGNQLALQQLKKKGYKGKIAAIAEYQDQLDSLLIEGVDAAFNIYNEAGSGFARHVCDQLQPQFEITEKQQH
ncbi:potassium transporter Kef [Vibrio sp. MACH09]|uniref:cation:proton antiporter family protein n=1 Tax=Vibrio sp. MACH09 TaxID=3025122 RepID=UPI00278DC42B|nr:cation:proton antiporter family protein [Vibrio sp. MACH09]GLO60250.1 potassium transporter Kef [Vibrio sp. MACH09]